MATYYHGAPEIQPDGLQTLYLMNPGFVEAAQTNMGYLNSSMGSLNPMTISHNPQHLVGIPLQPTAPWQDPDRPRSIQSPHEASAGQYLAPRLHYGSIDMSSQMGLWRPTAVPPHQQRLSLSLSPQQAPYKQYRPEPEVPAAEVDISPANAVEMKLMGSSSSASADSNGISGLHSLLMGSKYLKAAQRLLDEVVSLWKGTRLESMKGAESKSLVKNNRESEGVGEADANTTTTRGADLTTAEKQELQMKKAKLANMLDEVEQRYRQYRHQMQIVVSSFEAVAGLGSARTYTALALQTISKQFRCLRDAISGQIRATSKSLGEEDCPAGGARSAGSRLRFVDHHLRQQRALQQIGMIQHNTWRPQRGLPERAVSVLRAWLFEHFLHPYPKDSDKHMLAKQTGLTRSQVSNWFINARVRLWKPMVEEMYLEESKDQEQSNFNEEASKGDANEDSVSKSSVHQERKPTRTEHTDGFKPKQDSPNDPIEIPSSFLGMVESHEEIIQPSPKKARSHPDELSNRELLMQFMDGRSGGNHEYHHPLMAGAASNVGAFGAYSVGEIGRFDHEQFAQRFSVNGVSLTLGLPHSENLSLSGTHPSYLSGESINPLGRRVEMNTEPNDYSSLSSNQTASHPPNVYESISIQNRKRFAAQLLPDFVA